MKLLFTVVMLSVCLYGKTQIFETTTLNGWKEAGYHGSYPENVQTINIRDFDAKGNGINDDQPAIKSAIQSLNGAPGIIYFPAGNYLLRSTIFLSDSVILQGESNTATKFILDFKGAAGSGLHASGSAPGAHHAIHSGFEKGSHLLQVQTTGGLNAGDYIEIRQDNGSWDINPASWADHAVGAIYKVKDVQGKNIYLEEKLLFSLDKTLSPTYRKVKPITEVHIKCIAIERKNQSANSDGYNILFRLAYNCSVDGVYSDKSLGSHIMIEQSRNITVRNSFFREAFIYDGSGTRGYGVTLRHHAQQCLVENNIFKKLRHAMMLKEGAFMNVISYNYSMEPHRSEFPSTMSGDISLHGHFPFSNLLEGNIVQNIIIDHYWGPSGPGNTFFRNRTEMYGIFMTPSGNAPTNGQIFMYNETIGGSTLYGLFNLTGNGHIRYGNYVKGTLDNSNSGHSPKNSLYLDQEPPFWPSHLAWAAIGLPIPFNSLTIPAKERYEQNQYASCSGFNINPPVKNILDEFEADWELFPNPTSQHLSVKLNDPIEDGDLTVNIFDVTGKLVHSLTYQPSGRSEISLEMPDNLNNGIYYVVMEGGGLKATRRILRQ